MNGLVVRKSSKDDYPKIKDLFGELSDRDKRFLAWKMKRKATLDAARRGSHCYVADEGGDIVGFLRESGRPNGASCLEEFVVSPKHRGRGVATAMLGRYHEQFPNTTAKTKTDNEPMKRLLTRHGYKVEDPDAKQVLLWRRGADV